MILELTAEELLEYNEVMDAELRNIYGFDTDIALQRSRWMKLIAGFKAFYDPKGGVRLFTAPGRSELGGNHTDHQKGRVIAGAVNKDAIAAACLNGTDNVRLKSRGYDEIVIDLNDTEPKDKEKGTSAALVRGMAHALKKRGVNIKGMDIFAESDVASGSGISSSAAFEVLVGLILIGTSQHYILDVKEIAVAAQEAENLHFGKPCGLMDQMACALGGVVAIDFADGAKVEQLDFDLDKMGYALCIIDSGADHADLTEEYANITREIKHVSEYFGKDVLSQIDEDEFYEALPLIRKHAGDRAVLRACHYFDEVHRVDKMVQAVKSCDMDAYLQHVRESGESSWMLLQNIYPAGNTQSQPVAVALAAVKHALKGRGACRVHGGGFAGTVQAYVPAADVDDFKETVEKVLGVGACTVMTIRKAGVCEVTPAQ